MPTVLDDCTGYVCYLLANERGHTYAGSTNNIRRRLRQHNGELAGGAHSTRSRGPWRVVALVTGFTCATDALQFEWRMHHPPTRRSGVAGRLRALGDICRLERWTRRAPLAASVPLCIHVDAEMLDDDRAYVSMAHLASHIAALPHVRLELMTS